ncbi:MAG TPA: hypothetical protein VH170_00205, partial [Chthoniobacterales bacterium]|nr:hypothetical protein [Chthoniobacterales bacterium]
MSKSLRILAVIHHPWDPRLGASRVYVELASEWERAGHHVEKFCLTDAFPRPTRSRPMSILRQVLFARRAADFVRRNGARFDIIDALIGTLPVPKERLRFHGLIVGRSVGLPQLYEEFVSSSQKRWPDQPRGKLVGRIFYRLVKWMLQRNADRALRHCDLFNVANEDEKGWLEQRCPGKPVIVLPYGLNDEERAAFGNAARPGAERLRRKEICFLGMWSVRKGSRDWPDIVRRILKSEPSARFAFFGTMTDEQSVLRDLQLTASESIRCLPEYQPQELPQLIANCAVGLFPSYI